MVKTHGFPVNFPLNQSSDSSIPCHGFMELGCVSNHPKSQIICAMDMSNSGQAPQPGATPNTMFGEENGYYHTIYYHMSSRQNPLHLSSCYCYGYRFWGGHYRFPGVCGNQHIRDPTWSQNPFLKTLGNGSRSCFVGFRCFGNTSCSFHVAFICMHFPSFCSNFLSLSFHVPFICVHFHSFSFHVLLSFWFQRAFMSFHIPFICMHVRFMLHSCPFISF